MRIEDIHQFNFPEEINLLPKRTDLSFTSGLIPGVTNGFNGYGVHNNYTLSYTQNFSIPIGSSNPYTLPIFGISGDDFRYPDFNMYGSYDFTVPLTSPSPSQEIFYSTFTIYVKVLIQEVSGVTFTSNVKDLIGVYRVILKSTNGQPGPTNTVANIIPIISTYVENSNKPYNFYDSGYGVLGLASYATNTFSGGSIPLNGIYLILNLTDTSIVRYVHINSVVKYNM